MRARCLVSFSALSGRVSAIGIRVKDEPCNSKMIKRLNLNRGSVPYPEGIHSIQGQKMIKCVFSI